MEHCSLTIPLFIYLLDSVSIDPFRILSLTIRNLRVSFCYLYILVRCFRYALSFDKVMIGIID